MKRCPLGRLGVVTASVLLVAACGESSAPSDDVPALGQSLDRVDEAIVAGRYDDARAALEALVGTTTDAREEGELQRAEADRILRAADRLMSALPEEAEEPEETEPPAEQPTEVPPEEPPAEEQPAEEDPESEEDAEKEAEKQEKEEQKRLEELEKEAEKEAEEQAEDEPGNGNGDSSENGPDDGEGN